MVRTNGLKSLRLVGVATLAGLCASCGSLGALDPSNVISFAAPKDAAPLVATAAGDSDAPEIDCPMIEVQDGTAYVRVGGQANDTVRYQFDIGNTARECHVQGNQFGIKVGVAGHLLIGPAGAPGAYSTQLRIAVRRDSDQKPVFTKAYKIDADTAGASQAPFQFVSDPILLPYEHRWADQDYTILVGFDSSHAAEAPKPRHRKQHPN